MWNHIKLGFVLLLIAGFLKSCFISEESVKNSVDQSSKSISSVQSTTRETVASGQSGSNSNGAAADVMAKAVAYAAVAAASTSALAAAELGIANCQVEKNGGLTQTIVTYTEGSKTYAINGQARQRATARGWIDGKLTFTPQQMQEKLANGLAKCESMGGSTNLSPTPLVKSAAVASQVIMSADDLMKAVEVGDNITVDRYLKAKFDVNKRGRGVPSLGIEGGNAIASAAASGQCEILERLVAAGGAPDPKGLKFGFTPLNLAAQKGRTACVKFLIGKRVRLDVRTEPGGDTALILAAYQGHIDVVRLLVEAGASMQLFNKDGDTPLRAAQVFGNHTVAAFIKSKGGR